MSKKPNGTYLFHDFEEINEAAMLDDYDIPVIHIKGKEKPVTTQWSNVGTGYNGWQGNSTTSSYNHHHPGTKAVYESNGKALYAGKGSSVDCTSGHWDLIIDLASQLPWENSYGCVKERSAKRFDELRKHTIQPKKVQSEILSLEWPDMGTLPATLDFWLNLWAMLPAKTLMMCIGGHGRTGTCLTALMIVDGWDYYSALNYVRQNHCDDAVESLSQTRYLHGLYKEMLNRAIAQEQDLKELDDLKAELAYVNEWVPNNYSDFGEKEPSKPLATEKNDGWVGGDRLKIVNGVLYEQVCLNAQCQVAHGCVIADHLGWIEYDTELDVTTQQL